MVRLVERTRRCRNSTEQGLAGMGPGWIPMIRAHDAHDPRALRARVMRITRSTHELLMSSS